MKRKLKRFATEVLKLLEGMKKTDEEWVSFATRSVSWLGWEGKKRWK